MSNTKDRLYLLRTNFLAWLVRNQMFNTFSLAGTVGISIENKIPIAAVGYTKSGIKVYLNESIFDLSEDVLFVILSHELRHLFQLVDFGHAVDMFDWSPVGGTRDTKYFKKLAHNVFNYAGDMALNQDVTKLVANFYNKSGTPEEVVEKVRSEIIALTLKSNPETNPDSLCGILMPNNLQKLADEKGYDVTVAYGADYTYYGNLYIKIMADDLKQALEGHQARQDAINKMLEEGNFDEHMFEVGEGGDYDIELSEAARRALQKARNEGKRMARMAGVGQGNDEETITGKYKTVEKIKSFIKNLKIRVGVMNKSKYTVSKTYNRRNRKRPYDCTVPGKRRVVNPKPAVVIVLDTSGSMYDSYFLRAMASVVQALESNNKLAAAYTCDTVLQRLNTSSITNLKMKGGGGTSFDNSHIEQMVQELGADKFTVLYCTDEYVDLTEVKGNSNVELHIINIPEIFCRENNV